MKTEHWIRLSLVLATLLVYAQVRQFDFVNYDDPENVTESPHIRAGLTWDGVFWAFTTTEVDYWKPLTRLSHMLDCELFGLDAGKHHLTNLLLHVANVLLLFELCRRLTGRVGASGFVAALFALHPLHVSSVAWITERKDVLSTLFWMLTLLAYARYVERPGAKRYTLLLACFVLGLMSKPMLVTLPVVLLLLDIWPLQRLSISALPSRRELWPRVIEKVPLFLIAGVATVVTYLGTKASGQLASTEVFPFGFRLANALVSYVRYIGKMIWPTGLTFYYPYPDHWPVWTVAGSALILVVITAAVVMARRNRPYLFVGWFWYVVTLVPVIGLVQGVSGEAMADRFTYVPLIGLYIIVARGVPDLLVRMPHRALVLRIATCTVLVEFGLLTWLTAGNWSNSLVLCRHALEVHPNNHVAHYNLGFALEEIGETDEAIRHYTESIRIFPGQGKPHNNIGLILVSLGRFDEAAKHYVEAIRLLPGAAAPHNNLGLVYSKQGRTKDAIAEFEMALQLDPNNQNAQKNLASALAKQ